MVEVMECHSPGPGFKRLAIPTSCLSKLSRLQPWAAGQALRDYMEREKCPTETSLPAISAKEPDIRAMLSWTF